MIEITEQPIDTAQVLAEMGSPRTGAVLLFLGTARRLTGEKETIQLNYDCYRSMALKKLGELCQEARGRWPLEQCRVVHRIGLVPAGEPSLAVAVSSPHRAEAFQAAGWLIDTIKQVVPIWKQEVWSDGSTTWVHPGT